MKIALSSEGNLLEDNLDMRFGRAKVFIIYDLDNNEYEYIDNDQNVNAVQGAGIQSAQCVVDKGADAVITGYCGPKAYKVLEAAEVKVYTSDKDSIANTIKKFKNDELSEQEKDV